MLCLKWNLTNFLNKDVNLLLIPLLRGLNCMGSEEMSTIVLRTLTTLTTISTDYTAYHGCFSFLTCLLINNKSVFVNASLTFTVY